MNENTTDYDFNERLNELRNYSEEYLLTEILLMTRELVERKREATETDRSQG